MKKLVILTFASLFVISIVGSVALARGRQGRQQGQMQQDQQMQQQDQQMQQQVMASDILGETLYTQDDQEVGEIQRIFINPQQGSIASVSVDVSDFMQTEPPNLCNISWDQVAVGQEGLYVNVDARGLQRMCPSQAQQQRGQQQGVDEGDQRRYQRSPSYEDQQMQYDDQMMQHDQQMMQQDQQMMQQDQPAAQQQDMTLTQILGNPVFDQQNQEIGQIDEILIDRDSGEVSSIVIGMGGFLGIGETPCRISWDEITFQNGQLMVDMQEESGAACPYGEEWTEEGYQQEFGIGME